MWFVLFLGLLFGQLDGQEINSENCGVNKILEKRRNSSSFVAHSLLTNSQGTWPWMCSVGFLETDVWEHQCGGTLTMIFQS